MINSTEIPFPEDWDSTNAGAVNFYEKCLEYVEKSEDFNFILDMSLFFKIFGFLCILYMIVVNVMLFIYRDSYIFKRQCRTYFGGLLVGSLIISGDTYFLEIYYQHYPCIIHHLLTGIGYPLYLGSAGLIIIRYYKYYYKSQIAYFKSFFEF
ncbi:hypothetical protein BCR32DRAFT_266855, partial [Anaeromyces robustus]